MTRLVGLAATWLVLQGTAAHRGQSEVIQQDQQFSQTEITIHRSDSVYFHNNDTVVHYVFSTSPGNRFRLKPQKPGTSALVVFAAEGTVHVRCALHPDMSLLVNVE